MNLDQSQLFAVKTWITGVVQNNGLDEHQIAASGNVLAQPNYWVWKTSLGKHTVTDEPNVDTDGVTPTTFVWGGATGGFINRTQGERDAWRELFNSSLACKPNLANVRTAFADIFSGAGAGAAGNRSHLWACSQRPCTVAEKLFVTQTSGGPTQTGNRGTKTNPDTLGPEGNLTAQNVIDALNQ